MAIVVLTALGNDRAGLVGALSDLVAQHGGNWERSQMTELAGTFAGIVMVRVPDGNVDGLVVDLARLRDHEGLDVRAEVAPVAEVAPSRTSSLHLQLVGTDRPGIVREISRALAAQGVSIDELESATSDAPMTGGTLFEARLALRLPTGVTADDVRAALEAIADELMVDLALSGD